MKNKIKRSNVPGPLPEENNQNLIETYAEFYPDKNSKHCRSSKSQCSPSSYTIRPGAGRYKVRVYTVLTKSTVLDMQFNGIPVAVGRKVNPGEQVITEATVDTHGTGGDVLITVECKAQDCSESHAKMNMIEVVEEGNAEEMQEPESNGGKGHNDNSICGKYKSGPQCEDNTDGNVVNCLFNQATSKGAQACGGGTLILVKLPNDFKSCPQASNRSLCMSSQFSTPQECNVYCPGKCGGRGGMKCNY